MPYGVTKPQWVKHSSNSLNLSPRWSTKPVKYWYKADITSWWAFLHFIRGRQQAYRSLMSISVCMVCVWRPLGEPINPSDFPGLILPDWHPAYFCPPWHHIIHGALWPVTPPSILSWRYNDLWHNMVSPSATAMEDNQNKHNHNRHIHYP